MIEYHIPVMRDVAVSQLNIKDNSIIIDGTVGGGGHSEKIITSAKNVHLIAIDRDKEAIEFASKRLNKYKNIEYINDNFKNIVNILLEKNIKADGILLDLGVSSHQLDEKERGFSYKFNAPLDMRMNQEQGLSASDVVNNYTAEQLNKIFFEYGEEKFSKLITQKIITSRPLSTTEELKNCINNAIPNKKNVESSLKRIFQAIRIEVNQELEDLYDFILELPKILNKKARIVIITFHSLEDRIVKKAFNYLNLDCICPKNFPKCICDKESMGDIITKKPILPTESEINQNSRSASAKLRVFEIK